MQRSHLFLEIRALSLHSQDGSHEILVSDFGRDIAVLSITVIARKVGTAFSAIPAYFEAYFAALSPRFRHFSRFPRYFEHLQITVKYPSVT